MSRQVCVTFIHFLPLFEQSNIKDALDRYQTEARKSSFGLKVRNMHGTLHYGIHQAKAVFGHTTCMIDIDEDTEATPSLDTPNENMSHMGSRA